MMAVLHIHTENHDTLLKFYSVHVQLRLIHTLYMHCGYINGKSVPTCTGTMLHYTVGTLSYSNVLNRP